MAHIGKNIKKIRSLRGLSQQAFADLFQLTRGNISSYEELRAEPKIEAVVQIANYFSIPLNDFILKDLSVNELVHYKSSAVVEPEKLKLTQNLTYVPFVSALYLSEYIKKYMDDTFISQLPKITIPYNTKLKILALEVTNTDVLPTGYNLKNGDVLIFEKVIKENIHRLTNKMGMMIGDENIHYGIYQQTNEEIHLVLNELVKYPFNLNSPIEYWILKAFYSQV